MVEGKKLGLVGRCLLGAGLALGCASCENMTESDMFALGLSGYGVNAETPQQAQSAYVLSEFARESGRRQHEIDVAREGKTEVNVNVGGNEGVQSKCLYDKVIFENGGYLFGKILIERPSELVFDTGNGVIAIPIDSIIAYEYCSINE